VMQGRWRAPGGVLRRRLLRTWQTWQSRRLLEASQRLGPSRGFGAVPVSCASVDSADACQ
jgi:hypothetical protein